MAQPPPYIPVHSFVSDSATLANFPGQALDVEFQDIKTTTDAIRTNLALIQRDDGVLANGAVGYDQLSTALQTNAFAPASPWSTGTAYAAGTAVVTSGALYRCLIAHTSGVFATDLAAGKWLFVANVSALVNVADFGSATQAVASVIATTGGGTIVVPNGTPAPTLPASYPNVAFDYFGPSINFRELAESGSGTSVAERLLRGQTGKGAAGQAKELLAIEYRPVGADINGPADGSYALGISSVKQGWTTTTQPGEIGGISIFVRNGGTSGGIKSDCSGVLINSQNIDGSGANYAVEALTTVLNTALDTILKSQDCQVGGIDSTTGDSNGFVATAKIGTLTRGVLVQAEGSASYTTPFEYRNNAGTSKFSVDGSGNITGNSHVAKAAPTSSWAFDATGCVVSIANGSNALLSAGNGLVTVRESSGGHVALYLAAAGIVNLISAAGTNWMAPTTTPTAGKASVAFDGATGYRIYNNIGSTLTFCVGGLRMSTAA